MKIDTLGLSSGQLFRITTARGGTLVLRFVGHEKCRDSDGKLILVIIEASSQPQHQIGQLARLKVVELGSIEAREIEFASFFEHPETTISTTACGYLGQTNGGIATFHISNVELL